MKTKMDFIQNQLVMTPGVSLIKGHLCPNDIVVYSHDHSCFMLNVFTYHSQKYAAVFHPNTWAVACLAPLNCTYFMVGERWNVVFAPGKVRSYTDWLQEGSQQLH